MFNAVRQLFRGITLALLLKVDFRDQLWNVTAAHARVALFCGLVLDMTAQSVGHSLSKISLYSLVFSVLLLAVPNRLLAAYSYTLVSVSLATILGITACQLVGSQFLLPHLLLNVSTCWFMVCAVVLMYRYWATPHHLMPTPRK